MTPEEYRDWQPKYSKYYQTYAYGKIIEPHFTKPEHQLLQAAIVGLAAEAGELLGVLQKANRKGVPIPLDKVLDELSDVRWYYQFCLDAAKLTDDQVTDFNKKKLDERNK